MGIDIKLVENRPVGYRIKADSLSGLKKLEVLTFGEFVPPYEHVSKTHKQLYRVIEEALNSARAQQDSVTDGKRSVMLDVLANATLDREAMLNAMQLVKNYYL
jgi:hypothetical protein